jgi:hypothetical protein
MIDTNKDYFSILENNNRICVIYNYYEKNDSYKENFEYFLKHGILNDVDYYIVVNGESSINIPVQKNIVVYYRENKGFDFGAYSYVVSNKLVKEYDYYFFINTSVKGPYLRNNRQKWYDYFIPLFTDNTHLVGTSINICTWEPICIHRNYKKKVNPHVQSMFFCVDHYYFSQLKSDGFFDEEEMNNLQFNEIIQLKEVGLSEKAIEKGYNINAILSNYRNKDYRTIQEDINKSSVHGDPYYANAYFGKSIDPYEVIFYKTNRL